MIKTDSNFKRLLSDSRLDSQRGYEKVLLGVNTGRSIPSPSMSSQRSVTSPRLVPQTNGQRAEEVNIHQFESIQEKPSIQESSVQLPVNTTQSVPAQRLPLNIYKRIAPANNNNNTKNPNNQSDRGNYVLPNMMFFKEPERSVSRGHTDTQRMASSRPQSRPTGTQTPNLQPRYDVPVNLQNMEAFWDELLRVDYEQQGKQPQQDFFNLDISERNKLWVEMKNRKIDMQKKQQESKELSECTFKPFFYSKAKEEFQKQQEVMYQNFMNRMAARLNVTGYKSPSSPTIDPSMGKQFANPQNGGFFGSPMGHNSPQTSPQNTRYMSDPQIQDKLINYILNNERTK